MCLGGLPTRELSVCLCLLCHAQHVAAAQADPLNANVYIGSISPEVSDDELRVRLVLDRRCPSACRAEALLRTSFEWRFCYGILTDPLLLTWHPAQGYLEQFGQLLDMRIFRKNCYGFAQYQHHSDAVMAILGASFAVCLPEGLASGTRSMTHTTLDMFLLCSTDRR